jgi:hypothetical protein
MSKIRMIPNYDGGPDKFYLTSLNVLPFPPGDSLANTTINIYIRRDSGQLVDGVAVPEKGVVINFPSIGSEPPDSVALFAEGLLRAVSLAVGLEAEISAGSLLLKDEVEEHLKE